MSASHLLLSFLSMHFLCCASQSNTSTFKNPVVGLVDCRSRQIQAFTQFKNEFDTRGCNHSDFSNGVWCDNSPGAVTKLRLADCLSGTLHPNSSLFRLHQLRSLDLSHNNFTSSLLPSEFGSLNRLEVLSLPFNGFLAEVPSSFSNLTKLLYLDLSENDLTGSFPLVRNLSKLTVLELSKNHFSGTMSPNSSLFELHHLRYLNIGHNNFTSSLPSEFGNLHRLEVLSLSYNGFFGQVPTTFSNLTQLTELYSSNNQLTGRFPLVQNLIKLSALVLSHNRFTGSIPSSLFTMPFLSYLALRASNLTGSIEVHNSSTSSRLKFLYLGLKRFEGNNLEPISKLINLKELDISFLNTSYVIDLNLFSSLKSLSYLDLPGNRISPNSLRSDSYIPLTLQKLFLERCGISEFPNVLKNLQKLELINLSENRIKGKILEWLWSFPSLISVNVANNSFNSLEGSAEVLVNTSVRLLFLDSNNFEGALPNPPLSIKIFSVGTNSFTGEIPLSICNRSTLIVLDLSYNNFTVHIPQCLSNFTFVKLRTNNLEGSIPDAFCDGASLRTLDVGYNLLTGKLPRSLLNCSLLQFLSVDNNRIKYTFPFWLKALPNMQVLILRSNSTVLYLLLIKVLSVFLSCEYLKYLIMS